MKSIRIRGAKEHNLDSVDLDIPRDQLVVFTGVSGSGKSSLAFDTIYAEGQRRYVESLSAYARQFLGQMEKPHVDFIDGLSPAISIEQKSASKNPRSTVGTVTEIYDYLRLLFSRCGIPYCPNCQEPVGSQTVDQIVDRILELPEKTKFMVLAPRVRERKGEYKDIFEEAKKDGFVRVRVDGTIFDIDEDISLDKKLNHNIEIVVDRLVMRGDIQTRLTDSVETALRVGEETLIISVVDGEDLFFSAKNACLKCGRSFDELSPQHFSFNHPLGMCPECDGLGRKLELDPDLVVPNRHLSVVEGAIHPWRNLFDGNSTAYWARHVRTRLQAVARQNKFSLNTPWDQLSKKAQQILLYGDKKKGRYQGIIPEMEEWYATTSSEGFRSYLLEHFMHRIPCHTCEGGRLRPESLAVRFHDRMIQDVCRLNIAQALDFFETTTLSPRDETIAGQVLKEIRNRLRFLNDVGLNYLTLERSAPSLSGGEAQRIRLASQIGSALVGVLYVLDEPSIGLHQRDNRRLIDTLCHLRDLGNTVLVVEHDQEMMESADHLVDFGPGAGREGGRIVAAGPPELIRSCPESLTGAYLSGKKCIKIPEKRRRHSTEFITVVGAAENNLKRIDVSVPLGLFTCVTGVSGSGKSSLVREVLHKALAQQLHGAKTPAGLHKEIQGIDLIDKVIHINQSPIGRTPRSNPATYVKLFDPIRSLFAELPEAKVRGYKPGRFSFNVRGGRCEACDGDGSKRIEMHFLADVFVTCEVCGGNRFNRETLQVKFKGRSIADVLDLTVSEALELFTNFPRIKRILTTLSDVGVDYIHLGQPAPTLSGGEAQRIKLAKELSRRDTGKTFYILDEPTTGLHFDDIKKLLRVLNTLVDRGNTVVVIEHNLDVIKCAEWIIDLGPEGGDEGGYVIAEGTPEQVMRKSKSFTGKFLSKVLDGRSRRKRG
ncbi:MAG: excinuclease ABC subunit UvrA [bacterium]